MSQLYREPGSRPIVTRQAAREVVFFMQKRGKYYAVCPKYKVVLQLSLQVAFYLYSGGDGYDISGIKTNQITKFSGSIIHVPRGQDETGNTP